MVGLVGRKWAKPSDGSKIELCAGGCDVNVEEKGRSQGLESWYVPNNGAGVRESLKCGQGWESVETWEREINMCGEVIRGGCWSEVVLQEDGS